MEERAVTCRMKAACKDKQISISKCVQVCVFVCAACSPSPGRFIVPLHIAAVRWEHWCMFFRRQREVIRQEEERDPLLPPNSSIYHQPYRPPGSSPPSLFFWLLLQFLSVCQPAVQCVSACCVFSWLDVSLAATRASVVLLFLEAAGGNNEERCGVVWGGGCIEGEKKDGISGNLRTRCVLQSAGCRQQQHYKFWHHGAIALADQHYFISTVLQFGRL